LHQKKLTALLRDWKTQHYKINEQSMFLMAGCAFGYSSVDERQITKKMYPSNPI